MNTQPFVKALVLCFREIEKLTASAVATGESSLIRVRGTVVGRPEEEDVELELDHACEIQFHSTLVLRHKLPIRIIGEHGDYGDPNSPCILIVDPFDGTGPLFKMRPYRASVYYSVCTIYDEEGRPFVGGCFDIVQRKIYLAYDDKIEILNLDDGTRSSVSSQPAVLLSEAVVACYTMRAKYLWATMERAGPFFETFSGFLHPTGGSFMGAVIAVRKENVSAYLLGEELYSETVPSGAFITVAGLSAVVVGADGSITPFLDTFDVRAWRQDGDLYRNAPRMHLFVMAATRELLREMLRAIGVSD